MKATAILRENIQALLKARGQNYTDLAMWVRHKRAWLSKVLNGSRELQLKDLDRIADFFGVQPYQLFQPGAASSTERRMSPDRRQRGERRQSVAQRIERELSQRLKLSVADPFRTQVADEIARLLQLQDDAAHARESATGTRDALPQASRGRRSVDSRNPRKAKS